MWLSWRTSPLTSVRRRRFAGSKVGVYPRSHRGEGVEAFGARPLTVGLLQVAGRDVIRNGVAKDHGRGFLLGYVAAAAADHHAQLAFEVDALADRGMDYGLLRPDQRRWAA